jgi:Mg-chelatase subunit ChlD
MNMENAALGTAERIITTLLRHSDHAVHNRPGAIVTDPSTATGVRWEYVIPGKDEAGAFAVFKPKKIGKRRITKGDKIGFVRGDNQIILPNGQVFGRYQTAGIFTEVAVWLYRQVAEVWKLDNEFAARWASYAFTQDHKDLKVILAAFMLVQSRKGEPVREPGSDKVAFFDEDFRDVGEAMVLAPDKKHRLDPKLVLRIHDLLKVPQIAEVNRELGFTTSARNPALGRWPAATHKWLRYREENLAMLTGLVKSAQKETVKSLARRSGYKPASPVFFRTLGWKQQQAEAGHRTLMIGEAIEKTETWHGLTEEQICERIVKDRLGFKLITSMVPAEMGITRAIMAAAVEAGSLSDKELIIATPTLEDLGLLEVKGIKERWEHAVKTAEDQRASNIARNVKSKVVQEKLEEASDKAAQTVAEEVTRGIRVYFMVDVSSSMQGSIDRAKGHIPKFLSAFPLDRLHVSYFNTTGREVRIPHASAAGVENAFKGIVAGGGTDYGAGIRALENHKPAPDEDVLFIFVGDEGHNGPTGGHGGGNFVEAVRKSGLNPVAFGILPVVSPQYGRATSVRDTATRLGIPCFEIDEATFEDPYAVPRTIRALVASTPVGQTEKPRETLVDQIVRTPLLTKPVWAA